MKKKFEKFLEGKGISKAQFAEKTAEEMADLYNEFNEGQVQEIKDEISALNEKGATKEAVEALETKLIAILEEQGEIITEIKENIPVGSSSKTLLQIIEENKEAVNNALASKRSHTFTVKADTLNASVLLSTVSHRDNSLSPLASRRLTMKDVFRTVRMEADKNNTITYIDWDEATTVRAAAMVAEGGTFPESTAKWKQYSESLVKIGDSIPISEEFTVDNARFAGELENFLNINIALEEDNQLLTGDGTGNNLKGLDTYAPAYTAVAAGIQDASFYDLVPKVKEDISKGKGNKFAANIVIMNLTEINKYKLKKDANNNYVMPPFVNENGQTIDGALVLENNNVPNNVCYIGDSRYGTIYEGAEGYSVEAGYVNNQFLEDMRTLKARKRLCLLIKNSEKAGWRKVASISAALTTLAS